MTWRVLRFWPGPAGVALGLAAALALGAPTVPAPVLPPPRPAINRPVTARPPLAEVAASALARPLFAPDRRPGIPPSSARSVAGMPRLSGTLLGPDGRSAIVIPAGGKPVTVTEGAMLGEDRIVEIQDAVVVLIGPHGTRTLRLAFGGGRATPAPPLRFALRLGDR